MGKQSEELTLKSITDVLKDENGVFQNETTADLPPPPVASAQQQMAEFVQGWMREFQEQANSPAPANYTGAAVAHNAPAGFLVAGLAGAIALL